MSSSPGSQRLLPMISDERRHKQHSICSLFGISAVTYRYSLPPLILSSTFPTIKTHCCRCQTCQSCIQIAHLGLYKAHFTAKILFHMYIVHQHHRLPDVSFPIPSLLSPGSLSTEVSNSSPRSVPIIQTT